MIINKDSWHYKVWKWTYEGFNSGVSPLHTNFCSYMRRIMFLAPMQALLVLIFGTFYGVCMVLPINAYRLVVGYKPAIDVIGQPQEYSGLRVGSKELYPWHFLLPIVFIVSQVLAFTYGNLVYVAIVNAVLVALLGLVAAVYFFLSSDSTQVLRDWFWTNKRKICPTIEFGDHYDSQFDKNTFDEDERL